VKQPLEIKFDFPLAHSNLIVSLKATAELHHSDPYYIVDGFRFVGAEPRKREPSVLPAQEIKQIKRSGVRVWVHRDSERESLLSLALGRAIEKALKV
jgi:hypothetical protein